MKDLKEQFFDGLRELYRREERWLVRFPEVARKMRPALINRVVERHLERTAERVNHLNELSELMEMCGEEGASGVKELAREADDVLVAVARSSLDESVLNGAGTPRRRDALYGVLPPFYQN